MRDLTQFKSERVDASRRFQRPAIPTELNRVDFINKLHNALYAAMIIAYAQGMAQLRAASLEYQYHLDLETIARIWRAGCIIRAALLDLIRTAYRQRPDLPNLLMDPALGQAVMDRQADLRAVISAGMSWAIPVPGLMASLAYFDGYRSDWLPANLIQAQRDYFGAHTYERIDEKGVFHTHWDESD
jgi:6-phosphogluconate dehydrogenase